MFKDCVTDLEKNEYKRSKQLTKEAESWQKENQFEYFKLQRIGEYADVFVKTCELVDIPMEQGRFVHFIDWHFLFDTTRGYRHENLTPGFDKIIYTGLRDLRIADDSVNDSKKKFVNDYNKIVDGLIILSNRISESSSSPVHKKWFFDLINTSANSFEEALQRILFADQIMWQMGHRLIGLGHLDWLLEDLYNKDVSSGIINSQSAFEMICDFCTTLHRYYWLKSNVLMGDTGQIIILGGLDDYQHYKCNELTYLFIQAIENISIPDPKIMLRVSSYMPKELMKNAIRCMEKQTGSPILSNDDRILPELMQYGIEEKDCYLYGASACWEPLIPGKSLSPNNITYLAFPKPLDKALHKASLQMDYSEFLELFYRELKVECSNVCNILNSFRLQYDPLLSLFMEGCRESLTDVSAGGAKYNNFGITTVGLANTVNSLLNIKSLVFENKEYSIQDVSNIIDCNYEGYDNLRESLKTAPIKYGVDEENVLAITNNILIKVSEFLGDFKNYFGCGVKFGVSAPSYVDAALDASATFDGRKKGEPYAVHISNDQANGYTELINFASGLDYSDNRFNGNVIDIMVSPKFLEMNIEKVTELLLLATQNGFFQLQMNVIGSETLIEAKNNPDLYPNLIVRVWGFSAYFNELPSSYKEVLIARALQNEGKAYG